jgi:nicotinamidase-related amidase
MDALALGFQTVIASDAVQGVDYPAGSVEQAVETMKKSGVIFAESGELLAEMQK